MVNSMWIRRVLPVVLVGATLGVTGWTILQRRLRTVVVQADDGTVERIFIGNLVGANLARCTDDEPTRLDLNTPYTLMVFLSGAECTPCLQETVYWNRLSRLGERLRVVAIVVNATSGDAKAFLRAHGPEFEVLRFRSQAEETELGVRKALPLKVLVDVTGRVRTAAGPASTKDGQEAFYKLVRATVYEQ